MTLTEAIIVGAIVAAAAWYLLNRFVLKRRSCCEKKTKPKRTNLTIGGKRL